MTAQDPAIAKRIARIMRASRKRAALTQQTVAQKLGISQGALSKMEHGLLIPSAPQWFEFCDLTAIPPESLKLGYIDRMSPATLAAPAAENGFRIPRAFSENSGSKVRAVLPFLNFLRKRLGDSSDAFLRELKIDPDFFLEMDNQINLNLILEIARKLVSSGLLQQDRMDSLMAEVLEPSSHGVLQSKYSKERGAAAVLRELITSAPQYECNFGYKLEEQRGETIVMSVAPQAHLAQFKYRDDSVLGDFLCLYKREYFSNFPRMVGAEAGSVRERQCHFHGADRCVYEISFAG